MRTKFAFLFSLSTLIHRSEHNAAIEALKKQIKKLHEQKAERLWVLDELNFTVDRSFLEDFVTHEEIDDCLDDFSRLLEQLQDLQVHYHDDDGAVMTVMATTMAMVTAMVMTITTMMTSR